jgi:hypothetical protein
MTLANLIDLEAQLARDRDADPGALAARDRALLAGAPVEASRPGAVLARWLDALRERERAALFPGRAVTRALSAVRAGLAALGLVAGWGAASAVMTYGGGHPVNVWDFLLAFVGVQLVLLALLAALFLARLAAVPGAPLGGVLRAIVADVYPRLARRLARDPARELEWRALWHRLRSRRSLYSAIEPWLLLSLTQGFAVAFNLGALAAVLRLVVFTDVAFGWGTTLVDLDAPAFHALARAVAWPWRALWPGAAPSEALVEATRYSRLEGAYLVAGAGRTARPDLVGGWWPFLAAALAFYGLLPRAALLALSRARAARLLARLPHDDAEARRVVARLAAPHVETRAPRPEAGELSAGGDEARAPALPPGTPAALVLWRDVPGGPALEAAAARTLGRPIAGARAAGGRAHEEARTDWAAFAAAADPVVVVAEAFEAPDRGVRRLLAELRGALGPRRLLLVLLVGDGPAPGAPRPEDVRVWRDGLAALEDPWVAVEPLQEAS